MMGALFLNFSSVAPIKPLRVSDKRDCCSLRRKKSVVYCQGGGNVVKSSGFSSALTEREALLSRTDHTSALRDAGSLVLSPNEKSQAEIAVKDLAPYGEPSSSLVQVDDGIGIVKFLRGKGFLVTGATGFLAKGVYILLKFFSYFFLFFYL
jgi:fatty acyl-CoA reductase